jgi:general stress protein 26
MSNDDAMRSVHGRGTRTPLRSTFQQWNALPKEIAMHTPEELEAKFWKALKSDMTMMIGLDGVDDGHTRPMTAQLEEARGGPIWFFSSIDNELVRHTEHSTRVIATFASKDHGLFASVRGELIEDTHPDVIERLWNPFVAAWYEGGKNDPKLALLRLDAEEAEVWLNEHSLLAGIRLLFGRDPKKGFQDMVARVDLRRH